MAQKSKIKHPNPKCPECGILMEKHSLNTLIECYAEHSGMNEMYEESLER